MFFCLVCRVVDLDEMSNVGLFVNDLNLYDGSRDRVMAGHQHASRLEHAIEKVQLIYHALLTSSVSISPSGLCIYFVSKSNDILIFGHLFGMGK